MWRSWTSLGRYLRFFWWLPLAIPSLWFLVAIPPLWRDSDGFYQVRAEVGSLTLLLWPPLYCLLVRVPLALGARGEGVPFSFNEPALTDSGIGLLISAQHLLLVAALAWFVSMIARRNGIRLAICIVLACVPAFYAFANTVGSESLSDTLEFALVAGGISLLKREHIHWPPWLGYAILLALAVLTRHINAVFAALLPIAFLLRAAIGMTRAPRRDRVAFLRAAVLPVGMALLVGMAAIVAADFTVRALCFASGTVYRSKFGFVFQWRTAFVVGRSAGERARFFDALCGRLEDPLAIRALRTYEAAIRAGDTPQPGFLADFIKETLKKDSSLKRKTRLVLAERTLDRIAFTTMTSSPSGYDEAVLEDFRKNFAIHLDAITREPAASTQFFVAALSEPDFQPLRALKTFRDGYFRGAVEDFSRHSYLAVGEGVSIAALTLVAILLWIATLVIADRESWRIVYPPALLGTGWLLIFLNCCTTFFMPRFALPLLGTTLAALLISLSCLLERMNSRKGAGQLSSKGLAEKYERS